MIWDEKLCRQFFRLQRQLLPDLSWVYLYMDFRGEAGTVPLLCGLWNQGIHTAVPRTEGTELAFYEIRSLEDLESGYMEILEPKEGLPAARQPDALVLVPGLAFDREGHRMGYGGGFYDRFFEKEPTHPRWGLAYGFQMVESVPCEPWDISMDSVLTPDILYSRTKQI